MNQLNKMMIFVTVIMAMFLLFCSIVIVNAKSLASYSECKGNMTLYLLKNARIMMKKIHHHKKPKHKQANIDTIIDNEYVDIIYKEAKDAGVEPNLMVAICETESNGNPNVTGADGDAGLFQIIPQYNYDRMNELGINDIYDPQQNTKLAAHILKDLYEECNGDLYATLMFYNEGYSGMRKAQHGIYSAYATQIVDRYWELEVAA